MKAGRILAEGRVSDTLTEERLAEVYEIDAQVQGTQIFMKGAL